ncbi:MAG: metallophosphoesterase [Clostridia bacterium]|nr:metallophosphoesterase [Clostridia bacterium]
MNAVLEYLLSIILTIETCLSLVPNFLGAVTSYGPEEDGIILNCAVVSDTHADRNLFRDRSDILRNAYAGINESSERIDVLLNIGDITNSGVRQDYRTQKRLEKKYIRAKYTVACIGNHDSWHESADPDYDEAARLFLKYIRSKGIKSDKVYYSTVIDGYYFICLGTEKLDLHEELPLYSDEQLEWFDEQLTAAEKSGLPIFVLCHRQIAGRNGMTSSLLPAAVDEILQSHSDYDKPILFFSGHCHTFAPENFDSENNIYYINLPSLEYNDETVNEVTDKGGMGLTMEVYSDKIILKARNFITDSFIDGYRYEIDF